MANIRKAKYLVFEGVDGVGKSSVIEAVYEELSEKYLVKVVKPASLFLSLMKEFTLKEYGKSVHYEDVFSSAFRHEYFLRAFFSEIEYSQQDDANYDLIIYDRWWYTWDIYQSPPYRNEAFFLYLREKLRIVPTMEIILDADINIVMNRLSNQNDWMLEKYGRENTFNMLVNLREKYLNYSNFSNPVFFENCGEFPPLICMIKAEISKIL